MNNYKFLEPSGLYVMLTYKFKFASEMVKKAKYHQMHSDAQSNCT